MSYRVEQWLDVAFYTFIAGVLLLLLVAVLRGAIRDEELYAHCIADGHKDYECEAMLRGNR